MKDSYRVQANVNLDAICHNLIEARKCLNDGVQLMAIIKADGYGHGAIPIAWAVDQLVDAFGIAILEEGLALRKVGIKKPILILGYTSSHLFEEVIENDLIQTVFNLEMARELSLKAVALNKQANIHIKLDTGMSRIGFKDNDETFEIIKEISTLPNITIAGIFTHFAGADMLDKKSAKMQFERYTSFVNRLEQIGVQISTKHAANSAAIIDLPETYLNMVRIGISTYGLYPSEEVEKNNLSLQPALELLTKVVMVKDVEAGVGIGYGSTFVTTRKSVVGTIPIGYADGYPRALSNCGRVLINGVSAPIIGRICMDQFMVDLTDVPNVKEGDTVTLVGKDGKEQISVEELADMAYSFNYEFVCNISKRVPRIYYKNGKKIGEMIFTSDLTFLKEEL